MGRKKRVGLQVGLGVEINGAAEVFGPFGINTFDGIKDHVPTLNQGVIHRLEKLENQTEIVLSQCRPFVQIILHGREMVIGLTRNYRTRKPHLLVVHMHRNLHFARKLN
jgi:hypothetical protein